MSWAFLPSEASKSTKFLPISFSHSSDETIQRLLVRGGGAVNSSKNIVKSEDAKVSSKDQYRGVLAILGGAMCHLALGTTYCWGNFSPYTPSYLRYFGKSSPGSAPDTLWVLPGAFVAQMCGMPIGPILQRKIGYRGTTLLGSWLMASGVFLSSYSQNLITFVLCYSIMFGLGVGIAYTAPMVNGWKWFPEKKGLVSGCVVAGFGAGGFIFNQVGSRIINPNDQPQVNGLFPDEVYDRFPVMLRKISLIYFVLTGIGALLISPSPSVPEINPSSPVSKEPEGYSVESAVKSSTFWKLWAMALLSGSAGINIAGVYKNFGSKIHSDDKFQSLVGSLAALANGSGRLFWGGMVDSKGFKGPFGALASIQAVIMALYSTLAQSRIGFAFATCAILFCMGGNFSIFPAITSKVFGVRNGASIYSVMFSAFGIASVSGTFITKAILSSFGWNGVFAVMSIFSLLVLAVLTVYEGKIIA